MSPRRESRIRCRCALVLDTLSVGRGCRRGSRAARRECRGTSLRYRTASRGTGSAGRHPPDDRMQGRHPGADSRGPTIPGVHPDLGTEPSRGPGRARPLPDERPPTRQPTPPAANSGAAAAPPARPARSGSANRSAPESSFLFNYRTLRVISNTPRLNHSFCSIALEISRGFCAPTARTSWIW